MLRQGDAIIGALPMTQPIHVEVALKLRNKDVLDAFIANNVKRQAHNLAPQLMPSDQFLGNHAPTQAQAQAVADYLTGMGFKNVVIAPNRLLVSANGTALTAGNAFMTAFAKVRTLDGRIAFANTADARVPTALSDKVLAVVGLQNVYLPQASVQRMDAAHPTIAHPRVGHNPLEFASIYGGQGVATAAGVTIGLITQGDLTQTIADLNTFTANNSLATVSTQTVNTGGTGSDTSQTATWDVESQDIVGVAGGQVGKLVFYNVPTLTDASLTADLNTAVSANAAKIISVAYSECETVAQGDGSAAADDAIFETAVAQGQTFAVAIGDHASESCSDGENGPSWPASSQYVVAVGGTSLVATTTTWQIETVWDNPISAAAGGVSHFESMPSWQAAYASPATTRGLPDVAFDADANSGAKIVVNGASSQVGGTALSASLFAGLWARAIAVRGTGLGFAGPMLYSLWQPGDLHDITHPSCPISGEFIVELGSCATPGYDFVSGRGSINLNHAIRHLGAAFDHPPVANFSQVAGLSTATDQTNTVFTDLSADSDDSILSYVWNFGDGTPTSTAPNPSHSYNPGHWYGVTETVTDSQGRSGVKYLPIVVPLVDELLGNTGFETGNARPWSATTGVINNNPSEPPHSGSWDVWLDGKGVAESPAIWQQVAIPSGSSSAVLQFYLHIDTAETTTTRLNDHLIVRVLDSSGNQLAQLAEYSNLNAAPGYTAHNFDMSPYIGQTIRIKFTGNENGSLQTSFLLDDITLKEQ
jgi:subtilase family serine protease